MVDDETKTTLADDQEPVNVPDDVEPTESDEADESSNVNSSVVEPTVKELQEEAIALGMPEEDALKIKSKQPLRAAINLAKKREVQKVATLVETPNPKEEKQELAIYMSKAERMRAQLDAQPKVRFFLPIVPPEKPGVVEERIIRGRKEYYAVSGAVEVVQLNGYKTLIPKGVFVDIPQQVAEVLSDSMRATQQAGAEFRTDRNDPENGGKVADHL